MLRTRSEYVSRIGGGGPDRPKRDISPEPEAARDGGARGAAGGCLDEGWKAREGRGDGEENGAAKAAECPSLLGLHARGTVRQVGPLHTNF
jgi:hypothetical protein